MCATVVATLACRVRITRTTHPFYPRRMMSDFEVHIPDESSMHDFLVAFPGPEDSEFGTPGNRDCPNYLLM